MTIYRYTYSKNNNIMNVKNKKNGSVVIEFISDKVYIII